MSDIPEVLPEIPEHIEDELYAMYEHLTDALDELEYAKVYLEYVEKYIGKDKAKRFKKAVKNISLLIISLDERCDF